jgi:hypothetical protein
MGKFKPYAWKAYQDWNKHVPDYEAEVEGGERRGACRPLDEGAVCRNRLHGASGAHSCLHIVEDKFSYISVHPAKLIRHQSAQAVLGHKL